MTLGQQETNTVREQDTLLHGETLLVVASSDAEDIALELIAKGVTRDFGRDTLVIEDATIMASNKITKPSSKVSVCW